MTDDAPANGTPDRPSDGSAPAGPPPDQTVIRPSGTPAPPAPPGAPAAPPASGAGSGSGAPVHEDAPATTTVVTGATPYPQPGGQGGDLPPGAGYAPAGGAAPLSPKVSRAGLAGLVVPLGAGLLGAAIVISSVRSRAKGDLDWSNYLIGVGATAVLLLVALLGSVASRRLEGGRARADVVTWPGVVGILGVALMIGVGIDSDGEWVGYLIGAVTVALAALGYLSARRAAFVVTAIAGLTLLYTLAFHDVLGDQVDGEHGTIVLGAGVAVFVVAVTVVGWALPSRYVSGVVVGVGGLVAYVGMLVALFAMRVLGQLFGGFMSSFESSSGSASSDGSGSVAESHTVLAADSFSASDVWWILAFTALLAVIWSIAAAISNHSGFSILALAAPILTVPLATGALAVEHPSRWSAVLAVAGGLLVLAALAFSRLRGRSVARELPVGAGR
ncbi:hypothetical protein GCM10022237_31410 [Nocardioides ginsengisoli]|uniref:DMT family transporter n=1 Tax=Nocardioides ginsengisoli TaxID=363868 RepID=A0ABW3VT19_9ACTN